MSALAILGLIFGGTFIVLLIIQLTIKKKPKGPSILESYTPNGRIWVKKMSELYDNGLVWEKDPILLYEKTFGENLKLNEHGVKVSSYWDSIGVPKNYYDFDEKSAEYRVGEFFHEMERNLSLRFSYQYKPLSSKNESEVMKEYGLNIHSNEVLYYHSIKIDWYEEKTVRTNVTYGGFKYRIGGNMSYNTGSFSVVKNEVKDYVLVDRGSLFITNKRVIFVGSTKNENRTVNIDDILELSLFKDGLLLGKSKGKKPLIYVPAFTDSLVARDNLNFIIRVLVRVMSGTENMDLTPKDYNEA